jgi:hypothetical protein
MHYYAPRTHDAALLGDAFYSAARFNDFKLRPRFDAFKQGAPRV